jgi:hypothetical protein
MKGVLPWLVRWARHAATMEFCPANKVQNIIFLTAHFFTILVPIAQQPVQVVCAVWPVSVSLGGG